MLSDLQGANSATSGDSTGDASTGAANPQATLPDGRWSLDRQFPKEDLFLQKSKFEYILARLLALLGIVAFNAIKSIAIPALGCGASGLFWSYVRHEIEMAFNTLPSGTVNLIFPPSTILIHAILWNLRKARTRRARIHRCTP